jgi:hypothetical protein
VIDYKARLKAKDAAIYMGVASATLAKYRCQGGGPCFYKIGRRVLYDARDLDAYMAAHRRHSTSDTGNTTSQHTAG